MAIAQQVRLPSTSRYEFRTPIGEGGAGTVYRAYDRETQDHVAIKVLSARLTDNPTLHRRLVVEFQAASALEHPNIVRALDCQTDGEVSYLVYELVEGGSLGDRIEKCGKVSEEEAIPIITQLTQALHYAHERRIIHRDVKPDNVLLTAAGIIKLTDFGLAKDYNNFSQDITRPASALGTPHFMAPEQFADAKTADARCDIYSLAATLYNLLTGKLPFDAKTAVAILSNKELMRLPNPRAVSPAISKAMDAAIMAALNPNPDLRPASCLEFFSLLTTRRVPGHGVRKPGPSADGGERRADARFVIRVGCSTVIDPNIHGGGEEKWPLLIRDLSASGVGILMARRFEPQTELAIECAAGPHGKTERLPARIVRVEAAAAGHWVHGCEFIRPLTDEQLRSLFQSV
jgi:serine/threonine protein kinase